MPAEGGDFVDEFQLAALNAVHWAMSGEVVLMTLLGGLGAVFGPVVGALVLLAMETYLASVSMRKGLPCMIPTAQFMIRACGRRP